jgi:hypothetical protein
MEQSKSKRGQGEPKPDVQPTGVTVKPLNKNSSNASGAAAGGGGWENADALFFGSTSSVPS